MSKVSVIAGRKAPFEWGVMPELAKSQRRMDAYPAPARPEIAHALGIETTTFEQWAPEVVQAE